MADKNLEEYQEKGFYSANTKSRENGFAKFEKDGSYYFALYKDGDIVLLSQAYVGIAGRDNGIESVKKNRRISKRYRFDTRKGGKHGFGLYAGNGQEIAISANYGSKAEAERVAGRLNGTLKGSPKKPAAKQKAVRKASPKKVKAASAGRRGDYKPLKFYQARNGGVKDGFAGFSDGDAHFFTYSENGKIVLISESYTSKAGRDNGIASVSKNKPLKDRYVHRKHKNGKYYFDLRAGNRQEIATSIWYGTAAAGLSGAAILRGEKKTRKAKTAASKKAPRKTNDEDDYQPLAFYNKHTKGRKNGIEKFKGEDGLYYFAVFENGKIRLISEGYPTVGAQETGAASVKKNIKLEKRYDYRGPFKNGKYDFRLKAGNGKEIARSAWYGSAAAAATGAAYLMGTRKRVAPKPRPKAKPKPKAAPIVAAAAVATAAPAMAKAAKPIAPRDKDDDYLKCEEYHGHKVTDVKNNVALFSHSNNKEYFVVYDDDGEVLIRSEAFDSISKRSSELAAVLRLKDNRDNFTRVEKNGFFMDVLKDENGREVGRSCLRKIVPPVAAAPAAVAAPIAAAAPVAAATGGMGWGWLKWLLPFLLLLLFALLGLKYCAPKPAPVPPALVTCWDDSEADSLALCPQKVTCWNGSFVKDASACPVEPPKMIECWDGSEAKTLAACPAEPTPEPLKVEKTPPPAPKAAAPQPVAPKVTANMSRLCSASDSVLFNVPTYATPVSVGRLGTFPEFGDSHGLTPAEFYNKLANRYASNNFDRQYLNYLAKNLGYANGFGDMSAADFSNETLAKGTKGLLGYGEFHGMAYSTLDVTSPRDLEAFRVRAANGTDIHFMKTCGNYMYVCN